MCIRDSVLHLQITAFIDAAGHLVDDRSRSKELGEAVGEHGADELVAHDRLAIDDPLVGEGGRLLDQPLGRPETARRHHHPLEPEPLVGVRLSLIHI